MAVNDQLAEDAVDQGVEMARIAKGLQLEVAALLDELAVELQALLKASKVGDTPLPAKKLRELEAQATALIDRTFGKIENVAQEALTATAKIASKMTQSSMNTIIGPTGKPLTQAELDALAKDPVVLGKKMSTWWQGQNKDTQQRFIQQLRLGVMNGDTNEAIQARIVGAPMKGTRVVMRNGQPVRVPLRSGGIFPLTEAQAATLVRTSVNAVSNETLTRIYEQNQDVLKGIGVSVTLDSRTSLICISLYGGAWDFEGQPLPDSLTQIPYPGEAPYHMRCRTVMIPITRSWEELGAAVKVKVPPATRASMDGQVSAKMTFDQFLRRKPESLQKEILGDGRWRLWKDGKIKLHQLTDERLRPRSLRQLQQLADAA